MPDSTVDWLNGAGIYKFKAVFYERKLSEGGVKITSIAHYNPFVLSLFGITYKEHQRLILNCARTKCHTPCQNDGACAVSDGMYRCNCPAGFTGERCEVDLCDPNPCEYHGNQSGACRHDAEVGFTCNCSSGYEGKRCHKLKNFCQPDPCLNGGTCKRRFNNFDCSCSPPYYGKVCQRVWITREDYEHIRSDVALTMKVTGWKRRNSCLYKHFKEEKTFQEAEEVCASFNGHLASVHSSEELQFIWNKVARRNNVMLGGNDMKEEGTWTWTDGTEMNFTAWHKNEPNNNLGVEDCLLFISWHDPKSQVILGWNDIRCGATARDPFVCKVCEDKE